MMEMIIIKMTMTNNNYNNDYDNTRHNDNEIC